MHPVQKVPTGKLPEKNVTLCFSFLNFGLSDFMPSLRFNLEKYLMKASSTLSKRQATYDRKTMKLINRKFAYLDM